MADTSIDSDTLAYVAAGAKYLDETSPDWALYMNSRELDMSDGEYCVLGQYHGDYFTGLNVRKLSHDDAHDYGFSVLTAAGFEGSEYWDTYDEWTQLTYMWRDEIAKRLAVHVL